MSVATEIRCTVEHATPADREALAEMYRSFEPKGASLGLPPRHNPESWLDALSRYANFVVRAGSRVVGHAVLCPCANTGEVAVFVHQDYRGCGVGKALLSRLVEEARQTGLKTIWGTTELDNVPMLRLAYRLGFRTGKDPATFSLEV